MKSGAPQPLWVPTRLCHGLSSIPSLHGVESGLREVRATHHEEPAQAYLRQRQLPGAGGGPGGATGKVEGDLVGAP